jgi:Uma2 family endonuclease
VTSTLPARPAYPAMNEPFGRIITPEEFDALPENPQRELVDGVINYMAVPTYGHQIVARDLCYILDRLGRPHFRAAGPMEARLEPDRRRNPDVVVVLGEKFDMMRSHSTPEEIVLAVEVVSPGTQTTDRREKWFEYAEAGIPHFWRVELDPLEINTFHRHRNGLYVETGKFGIGDTVAAPGLEWAAVTVAVLAE